MAAHDFCRPVREQSLHPPRKLAAVLGQTACAPARLGAHGRSGLRGSQRCWAERTRTRKRHFCKAVEMLGKFSSDHPNTLGPETFRARAAAKFWK
jgi:hypothetical protein